MSEEKDILVRFGENIRSIREEKNMTISELSALTGIREGYLKKIEAGKAKRVSSSHVFIFAKAFNMQAYYLLVGI